MPCSYYMHHDPGSESDESSQITVVTDNNGIWADGFSLYGNAWALQSPPSSPHPCSELKMRGWPRQRHIGCSHLSYPHNSCGGKILTWHAKDPSYLGSPEKRWHCVCVCRYLLKGAVCIGIQWKERRIGTLWKVTVFIRLRWWIECQTWV